MIVPMKKISLVVMDADHEASLEKLREIGVLHPEKKSVSSDVLGKLLERKAKIGRAAGILNRYPVKKNEQKPSVGGGDISAAVLNLADEKKSLQDQLAFLAKERRKMEGWGNFDPQAFSYLQEHGITLIPYELSQKEYNSLDEGAKLLVISRDKRGVKLLSTESLAGYAPFVFSNLSIAQIDEKTDGIKKRCDNIEKEMQALAYKQDELKKELAKLQTEIEFETANAGMENREDAAIVCWINGFVPGDKLGVLKRAAAEYGWALVWEDPAPGDKPPTLVKNNKAVKIIQPLFSFLGTVPGYREYDISPSYLIFFCLFFAMIFGDAAYGSLLFIISFFAGLAFKKKSGKVPDAAKLFMLLSFCTIVWGSITGSWFSIPEARLPSFMRSLIIPPFNGRGPLEQFPYFLSKLFNIPQEFIPKDDLKTRWNIQFLCFTVGAIQLVWARGKNIIKMLPSLTAFSQLGWLVMMIGLYFLVLNMLLKVTLVFFAVYMIGGGLALYFIFAEQKGGNFFKNIGKSFTNFLSIFLNAVGSFADIISYIRLFAVGLAGSIIAQSFNEMAVPVDGFGAIGLSFFLRLFAAVLILVFGHALNIVMNALSVIVHGVRLNLLEYAANHLGMEWSGYAYKPFELKNIKSDT